MSCYAAADVYTPSYVLLINSLLFIATLCELMTNEFDAYIFSARISHPLSVCLRRTLYHETHLALIVDFDYDANIQNADV